MTFKNGHRAAVRALAACVAVLLLAVLAVPRARAAEYRIGPPAQWVLPVAADTAAQAPASQVSHGEHFLLLDTQTRLGPQGRSSFRHVAVRALNERGVESAANIQIGFDPAYQQLSVHWVRVYRGGRAIPKLQHATVRVLQREKDLEYRVYDGSKTLSLFLDDIRVGDVIDYAYTLDGANPVFGNRLFGRFDLQWDMPLHQAFARLVVPAGREVRVAPLRTTAQPQVQEQAGVREYVWRATDVEPQVVEDDAPSWFDPYAAVQWSEFADWGQVVQWALPLYRAPQALSPALQAEARRLGAGAATPAERLLAVLGFVQHDIRYLGVEIGPGSHEPYAPDVVLKRRFGDCKDKALLTVTLLRALGVQADPVLVNTDLRNTLSELQPSPGVFNHAIVRARVDGSDYWLDPTRPPQKGDLATLVQADYGRALVIAPGVRALSAMARSPASMHRRRIEATIDAREGFGHAASYAITTVAEGASAEALRSMLASVNRQDLQRQYLNFYARYYPKISVEQPFTVEDDDRANRLTMTEHYRIDDFWAHAKKGPRVHATVYMPDVEELLRAPGTSIRRSPLAVAYPREVEHTTELLLPGPWHLKPEHHALSNAAFEFERTAVPKPNGMVFTDRYAARADAVPAAAVAQYAADLERARDWLGYEVSMDDGTVPAAAPASGPDAPVAAASDFNWPVATIVVLWLALLVPVAARVYRHDPPPAAPGPAAPDGIAGWLLVPAFIVVVMPLRFAWALSHTAKLYHLATWSALTTPTGAAFDPHWAPLMLLELLMNLGGLVFALLLAVVFFQRRRGLPGLFIWVTAGVLGASLLDLLLASAVPAAHPKPADWQRLAGNAFGVFLWAWYFRRSHRVRATFVHDRAETPPARLDPDWLATAPGAAATPGGITGGSP